MVRSLAYFQPNIGSFLNKQGKATLSFIHSAHSLHPHHHYSH